MTDLSTRHPHVTFATALAELQREIEARHRTYPDWITRGRMTQDEATHQIAIFQAIATDITRLRDYVAAASLTTWNRRLPPADHRFTWHQRREAIAREQTMRARIFPDWVAKGRLEQPEATRRQSILNAIADVYDDGLDWTASNGLRVLLHHTPATAAEEEAQTEWWHHYRTVMQARGLMPTDQKELFA